MISEVRNQFGPIKGIRLLWETEFWSDFFLFSLGEIGSGVHSDYGGITVLHADGPGLYVLRPNQTSAEVC